MKGWFGPLPGTNVAYSGVWVTYNVMPVSWQGWLVTLVYLALQAGAAIVVGGMLDGSKWSGAWLLAQLTVLHLIYLWVASRHYVSWAEMDRSVLPSDMRGKNSDK